MADSDSNPSLKLSSILLNGYNYITWSRAVTLSLGGKKKLKFINGNSTCPADVADSKYEDWMASDQLVRSWLLNSMEPHVAEIFTFSDSAKALWYSLTEFYGNQNNATRIFELKTEITAAEQGDKTFSEHLRFLKKLWDELNIYRPHTTDERIILQRVEENKIFSLLNGLKPDYENLRSNVIMGSQLPSFSNVCNAVQREKTRRKTMKVETEPFSKKFKSHALASEKNDKKNHPSSEKGKNTYQNKGRKGSYHCDHCGKNGHTKDRCWELHPHLKKDRAALAESPITMNQLSQLLQKLSKSMPSSDVLDQSVSTHVSGNLRAYLTSSSKSDFWIIDSGATDHMAKNPSCVYDFLPQTEKHDVTVVNGSTIPVLGKGKIKFLQNYSSSDSLVVPLGENLNDLIPLPIVTENSNSDQQEDSQQEDTIVSDPSNEHLSPPSTASDDHSIPPEQE
ncbi:hypothetical protein LWI28_028584 [Acer negundo]|uniref:Retrovirus-related Pol polyprotein from transposon TNT 1-94-like beta-barrel domain-containing protein n=1 Tax=Acer negundo TaxID=4023 RepID=A0AAD5NWI1_ACENE|nr:hypothetical protein LWI28_028584 [Acer negundo]